MQFLGFDQKSRSAACTTHPKVPKCRDPGNFLGNLGISMGQNFFRFAMLQDFETMFVDYRLYLRKLYIV
jgi:hypothetical protein